MVHPIKKTDQGRGANVDCIRGCADDRSITEGEENHVQSERDAEMEMGEDPDDIDINFDGGGSVSSNDESGDGDGEGVDGMKDEVGSGNSEDYDKHVEAMMEDELIALPVETGDDLAELVGQDGGGSKEVTRETSKKENHVEESESAGENSLIANRTTKSSSNILIDSRQREKPSSKTADRRTYYAVRVGYAVCPTCSKKNSLQNNEVIEIDKITKKKSSQNSTNNTAGCEKCNMISVIRSAIFLRWQDVKEFVDFQKSVGESAQSKCQSFSQQSSCNKESSAGAKASEKTNGLREKVKLPFYSNVEYRAFDSIEKAEKYLRRVMPIDISELSFITKVKTSSLKKKSKMKKQNKPNSTAAVATVKKSSKSESEESAKETNDDNPKPTNVPRPRKLPPNPNNPPTKRWEENLQRVKDCASTNGNLDWLTGTGVTPEDESLIPLHRWIKNQRRQYKLYLEDPMSVHHNMTSQKVHLLKEVFDWIVADKMEKLQSQLGSKKAKGEAGGERKRGRPKRIVEEEAEDSGSESECDKNEPNDRADDADRPKTKRPRKQWLIMLQKIKLHREEHGTITISNNETNEDLVELREWCKAQKLLHNRWKRGLDVVGMTQEKEDLLAAVGFEFKATWDDMYNRLLLHKEKNGGDINVSKEEDEELASWIRKQNEVLGRHLHGKTTRLTEDRAMRLMSLGFQGGRGRGPLKSQAVVDHNFDTKWNEMLLKLRDYKAKHGNSDVPQSRTELSKWVCTQRRLYKKLVDGKPGKRNVLDALKIQRLKELGFQFRPKGSYLTWDDKMILLRKYVDENGHCLVPVNHPTLGKFVRVLRSSYKDWVGGKKSKMTPELVNELMNMGFVFEGCKRRSRDNE